MSNLEFIGQNDFKEKVLASDVPVLIDFYADWCAPCKMMEPSIEQVAQEFSDKMHIYKVNVDDSPVIAASYQIMSIPTLLIFKDGAPVSSIVGAVSYKVISEKLLSILEE